MIRCILTQDFCCGFFFNPLHYRPAMSFGNRNMYFRGSFQFTIVTVKKISPHLKFNILGICQSLKLRILAEKNLPVSLNLNFTPNTLGCYGLRQNEL